MIALRLGFAHPDHMDLVITPGQYEDWVRVHHQINLAVNREDLLWGLQRAEFLNANMPEDGTPIQNPLEVMPYATEDERYAEDLVAADVAAKIACAPGFAVMDGPIIPTPPLIAHLLMKLAG